MPMNISLLRSTGSSRIDEIVCSFIAALEAALPGRVRGISLSGSVANGTSVSGSDVDGLLVFKGALADEEAERFSQVARDCSRAAGVLLDFLPRGEDALIAQGELPAKRASRTLIYGEEPVNPIPPMSVETYTHLMMRGSFLCLQHVHGSTQTLRYPLDYPDPEGEFFGYERRGFRDLDGWRLPGTKALVNGLTLAASTIVGIRTGHGVVSRRESVTAYRERIGDQWTGLLEEIYDQCRTRWGYLVPEDAADRARLRRLCEQVLPFENHYLQVCREHLTRQLSGDDHAMREPAGETLRQLDFGDTAVNINPRNQESEM
jgi:hypothetical protein